MNAYNCIMPSCYNEVVWSHILKIETLLWDSGSHLALLPKAHFIVAAPRPKRDEESSDGEDARQAMEAKTPPPFVFVLIEFIFSFKKNHKNKCTYPSP